MDELDKARRLDGHDALADNPAWDKAGHIHDWRNHVSERLREHWSTFTVFQRAILALDADELASNEEWE